jgi:hypothetical protein
MARYKLTLTLTTDGKDGHSPKKTRRDLAQLAARNHNVTVNKIQDNADQTITWDVTGTEADVCAMIKDWTTPPKRPGKPNVTVKSSPTLSCT